MAGKRGALVALLAAALTGCTKHAPTHAGGKPVAYWVQALDSPDAHLRREAVEKLGNVGPADPAARPAVLRALRDKDANVRKAAVVALRKFGPPDPEASGLLTDLKAHDPDPQVRSYAARALEAPGNKY
ncbi:MAG TPA: HEAT repeat domain-containing protein [Gemmataceae bacterium]|nr:HEAT repeat domain-containing protein [Gemmataceae bacterium]